MKFVGRVVSSTRRFDKSPYNKKAFLPVGLKATTRCFPKEVEVYGERNAWRYPAYHRLDLNVVKKYEWKSRPMEFYIDLANVYARLNVLAYSEDGDTWIQMPPLATIGIRGKIW